MEASADSIPQKSMYKLLIGSIVPRPIGWISTVNAEGQPNLAPYSFFNAVGSKPPHLIWAPQVRSTDSSIKDSLSNVKATGEFVANIVTEELAYAMNVTATELPSDIDEFEYAEIATTTSVMVKPPRVAASPIHYECVLREIVELGDGSPGSSCIVIGRIVHVHIDESVLLDDYKINLAALKPVGRLAGNSYTRVTDLFELIRPPSRIQKP